MPANLEKIRSLQRALRAEAQKGNVEEALNALAAVAAEAISSLPGSRHEKEQLLAVFGMMVQDAMRQAESIRGGGFVAPPVQ